MFVLFSFGTKIFFVVSVWFELALEALLGGFRVLAGLAVSVPLCSSLLLLYPVILPPLRLASSVSLPYYFFVLSSIYDLSVFGINLLSSLRSSALFDTVGMGLPPYTCDLVSPSTSVCRFKFLNS